MAAYLETLEMVKGLKAAMFVPAHAPATSEIAPLAQLNIDKVHQVAEKILNLCQESMSFERILQRLFNDYGLTMTYEQYVLVGSTVRSYLAWLKDIGRLDAFIQDNQLLWRRV